MTTLSPEQLKAREGKLTASAVKCLMTGDEDAIRDLWRKLVGDPTFEREDLSKRWPVQLGAVTEQLNLNWYGFKHNPVIRRGEVITHPTEGWPLLARWMAGTKTCAARSSASTSAGAKCCRPSSTATSRKCSGR